MNNNDYKELCDSVTIGLWRTTIDEGKFLTANLAVAQILGYDNVGDLMSHTASDLYDRSAFIEELKELQEVENVELAMNKKDGTLIWISLSAKIYNEKGYIEGSIRDITEEKRQQSCFLPHLQKLSSLKESIKNRLKQYDYSY